jgi:dTDP-4-amino-4,6-dideoxygalactose transaminase
VDVTAGAGCNSQAKEGQKDHPRDYKERQGNIGMDIPTLGPLPPFNTIGSAELTAVAKALRKPLSGYLGGVTGGGYWISRLSEEWCSAFGCKYAIPCNSATSGLLAACMAVGVGPGDIVWCPAMTMSATAACAKVLGADIVLLDIETLRFSMNMSNFRGPLPKCIIVTNLFGHPAYLASMRTWCDSNKVWMIEDNAQSPFAKEGNKYAGTVGHVGVFSLNVHKHVQCGEGGVIVTDNDGLSSSLADCINHGELAGGPTGLNLRMTETTAAIACVQLEKAKKIIAGRIELAQELSDMLGGRLWLKPPICHPGCKHVYYTWAGLVEGGRRKALVRRLNAYGFPMRAGYSPLLHRIFGVTDSLCPVAEHIEDNEIITFEVCRYDPSWRHRRQMRAIAKKVLESVA